LVLDAPPERCTVAMMKDRRLEVFRKATLALIESLDAVVRLSRWGEAEAPPEPLVTAGAQLLDRLGAADRLSSGRFNGSPADASRVTTMCAAMKRLDAAYLAYRQDVDSSPERAADAAATLEHEVGATRAGLEELTL
jgi:hypothetical protein